MQRWILLVVAAVLVAAGAWWVLRPRSASPSLETVTVKLGDVASTVSAPGEVVPQRQISVYTKTGGLIKEILVKPGAKVQAGQVLLRLSDQALQAQISAQEAQIASLAASVGDGQSPDLQLAQDAVRQAQIALDAAQLQLKRAQADFALGAIPAQQLDQARTSYAQAQLAVQSAVVRADQARQVRTNTLAQLQSAKAQLQQLQNQLTATEIRAPMSGTLINLPVAQGQAIPADTLLAQVADLSSWLVQSKVAENDLPNVAMDMKVNVSVSALQGGLSGKVIQLGQVKQYDRANSSYYYQVISRLTKTDPALASGMSATANFITQEAKNVPIIPLKALQTIKGKTMAELLLGSQTRFVEVKAGIDDGTNTAIESGLKPGDKVVLPPPPGTPGAAPSGLGKALGF